MSLSCNPNKPNPTQTHPHLLSVAILVREARPTKGMAALPFQACSAPVRTARTYQRRSSSALAFNATASSAFNATASMSAVDDSETGADYLAASSRTYRTNKSKSLREVGAYLMSARQHLSARAWNLDHDQN